MLVIWVDFKNAEEVEIFVVEFRLELWFAGGEVFDIEEGEIPISDCCFISWKKSGMPEGFWALIVCENGILTSLNCVFFSLSLEEIEDE
jgi:hypothetical protein